MRIGVYIGSFNPPHKGHIKLVNYLLEKDIIDKALIIPTGSYWNKQDLAPLTDRIKMLQFYETDNIQVDKENNTFPYTYELMRELKRKHPDVDLYLIIGADNIINFDKWKEYEELLQYRIIVMPRGDINIDEYLNKYPQGNFIIVPDYQPVDISSTEIRNNIDNDLLDPKVRKYIIERGLYKKKQDLE